MKIVRGYTTELDPTPEQYILFCQCAGAARFSYNYGLSRKQEARKTGASVPYANDLQCELTAKKHGDFPWLLPLSKWIVQNSLRDLDDAFKRFFKKCQLKKQGLHKRLRSIFPSHETRRVCEQLGISKQEIKKRRPYQNFTKFLSTRAGSVLLQ